MVSIEVRNASVDFPIFDAKTRSLKKTVLGLGKAGGRIGTESRIPVIEALRDITVSLEHGDRVALVGHNGAGKTTLLRLLAGVLEPDTGKRVQGQTVRLAYLSQELHDLPGSQRVLEAVEEVARRVTLGKQEMSASQLAEAGITGTTIRLSIGLEDPADVIADLERALAPLRAEVEPAQRLTSPL